MRCCCCHHRFRCRRKFGWKTTVWRWPPPPLLMRRRPTGWMKQPTSRPPHSWRRTALRGQNKRLSNSTPTPSSPWCTRTICGAWPRDCHCNRWPPVRRNRFVRRKRRWRYCTGAACWRPSARRTGPADTRCCCCSTDLWAATLWKTSGRLAAWPVRKATGPWATAIDRRCHTGNRRTHRRHCCRPLRHCHRHCTAGPYSSGSTVSGWLSRTLWTVLPPRKASRPRSRTPSSTTPLPLSGSCTPRRRTGRSGRRNHRQEKRLEQISRPVCGIYNESYINDGYIIFIKLREVLVYLCVFFFFVW